jgi:hypothetical protein
LAASLGFIERSEPQWGHFSVTHAAFFFALRQSQQVWDFSLAIVAGL